MSKLAGGQQAYPVYLTIGNISKSVRRKATRRATVILGYLPAEGFSDVTNKKTRTLLRGELLHRAMRAIMEPLEETGRNGVPMWCADGRLRRIYPLVAAFVGDWPEQNDMACTTQSGCPMCQKKNEGRGDGQRAPMRSSVQTLTLLDGFLRTKRIRSLKRYGLKPWWPWWANLPGIDFHACITPDLLHQVHQGLFKSHAMKWVYERMTKPRVDERFASMTRAKDLRHFKRGVSKVKQWTGRETKEMMKTFLAVIVEHKKIPEDLVMLIRTMLDFAYLAHSARMTETELEELEDMLSTMGRLRSILIRLGIYAGEERWDGIPKWHMVTHYPDSIRELGTPDGYNTEAPEYLHIVYVKRGWAASNKRNAIPQIIKYCQRLEALRMHRAYLDEYYGISERSGAVPPSTVLPDEEDEVVASADVKSGQRSGGGGDDDDDWEDVFEDDEDDEDAGEEVEVGGETEASDLPLEVEYPHPIHALAMWPTQKGLCERDLIDQYGASDLLPALKVFLGQSPCGQRLFLLPSDLFDVWHKLTLNHLPLFFAPDEPLHRDVVRAQPAIADGHGGLRRQPTFDTALFLKDPDAFGPHRKSY
jgi:hypothetical protein